jgi:hypothetical protein
MLVIYRRLKAGGRSRTAMLDGLALALESTPRQADNAAVFYYLLHAAAVLLPLRARNHLRVLLRTRALSGLEYGETSLETLLLSAASKYSVDDDIVGFIGAATESSDDLPFLLTSFRILASRSLADTWTLAERILSMELEADAEELFADELKIVADEHDWPALYRWYSDGLTVLDDGLSQKLLQIITGRLIPFFEDEETTRKPAFHLMKAHAAVVSRSFTSQHLVGLARFAASTRGMQRKKYIEGVRAIYEFGRRSGSDPLWFYVDHDAELDPRTGTDRHIVGFVSRYDPLDERGVRRATFLMKNDPDHRELIDVLVEATPDDPLFGGTPRLNTGNRSRSAGGGVSKTIQ